MEEVRIYLEQGRRFREVPPADLNRAWAHAFDMVWWLGEKEWQSKLADLGAELRLRSLPKPTHLIQVALRRAPSRKRSLPRNEAGGQEAEGRL